MDHINFSAKPMVIDPLITGDTPDSHEVAMKQPAAPARELPKRADQHGIRLRKLQTGGVHIR
ncbi:MAG: hypothetical protein ACOYNL_04805 [Rickettsiales bacterium]